MKKYLLILSLFIFSCEEEITLELPSSNNQLVVEGAIESGYPPYVILTKNQGYFDEINENTFSDIFVKDADSVVVWYVNDSGEKEIKELKLIPEIISDSLLSSDFPVYTINDINELVNIIEDPGNYTFSAPGRTYFLEIHWNNNIYSSSTTIPTPTPLDCLWVEKNETAEKEHKCDIRAIYSDDGSIQNNILIKTKRLEHWRKDSLTGSAVNEPDDMMKIVDAGSDVLINGESFETYFPRPSENGFPTGKWAAERFSVDENNDSIFLPNDLVLVKFCQIDEPSLKFWRSLVRQSSTNGNPFAEPTNLVGNINNGLGIWTGYGSVYYQIPIIKGTVIFEQNKPEIIDIF